MSTMDSDSQSSDSAGGGAGSTRPNVQEPKQLGGRRWSRAIGLGLLGSAAAAALMWWLVPVRYEAFALLKVSGRAPVSGRLADSPTDEFAVFKRTQVNLIRSSVVLLNTVREPAIAKLSTVKEHDEDLVNWLSDQLLIDYPNDAEVMRIAMKGQRPAEVASIVNQVVATYKREIVEREKEVRNQERTKLAQSHDNIVRELTRDLEALHKLEEVQGIGTSEAAQLQKKLVADKLEDLTAERREILRDLRHAKLQIMLAEARQEATATPAEAPSANNGSEPDPLSMLYKEKELLESSLTETEHGIQELAKGLQDLEKYSAEAASSRERLAQRAKIAKQIDERLRLIDIESLAPERIQVLDPASVPAGHGDRARKQWSAALAAALSFGVIVVGVALAAGKAKSPGM